MRDPKNSHVVAKYTKEMVSAVSLSAANAWALMSLQFSVSPTLLLIEVGQMRAGHMGSRNQELDLMASTDSRDESIRDTDAAHGS